MHKAIAAARLAATLAMVGFATGCAGADMAEPALPVASDVDLEKIYGGWYIVANIPNWFEKDLVGLYDIYSRRADGDIDENFYTHDGASFSTPLKHYEVHDWVQPGTHNAKWQVQIFWPLHFPFWVLYVDPGYQFVLFGYPDRSLGWIFSRRQTIDEATYQSLLGRFGALGYDVSKFRRIVQLPSQIGQKGFGGEAGEK
jgi:apolipoprotein D and lipocalin family protein